VLLRTRDVLERTKITRQTLYRYITAGLIREAAVTESGRLLFAPEVVAHIRLIRELNESGYTLQDLKEIFFSRRRPQSRRRSAGEKSTGAQEESS